MECVNPKEVLHDDVFHKVPCGKCGFCLESKRSQWMFRIHWEMFHQLNPGWFLTLTYDEKHVKRTADHRLSLRFKDVQLFFKKLRRAKYVCKYICVGEYGTRTLRPHYHVLLWTDCRPEKLERYWTSSKDGSRLGSIHIGRITMQSAMYTLKYILQPKQRAENGIERTRAQFSHGLGLSYLSTDVYNYHTWDYDAPVFVGRVDGQQVGLPRYYQYKIFTKYQRHMERVRLSIERWKEKRKLYAELRAKGIKNCRVYLQRLRNEQAKRIIKESKFNQSI